LLDEKLELWLRKRINELDKTNSGLRQLVYQNLLSTSREKQNIGSALHDNIAMGLLCCNIKLKLLQSENTSSDAADILEEVQKDVSNLISKARGLINELNPALAYRFSMEVAITELARETEAKYSINCRTDVDDSIGTPDADVFIVAFQSMRELLCNAARHAFAENISISARGSKDNMVITVQDDGIGFDVARFFAETGHKERIGLLSIHEWLRCVGGQFEIDSKPGGGTRTSITFPLTLAAGS
jgi:signal transduction histidine kinase